MPRKPTPPRGRVRPPLPPRPPRSPRASRGRRGKHVVVFGAGGNIGSHLVPLLARALDVGRLTLVDGERYESGNLRSQDIHPRDVGRWKARVQAARARRLNPKLGVVGIAARLENVPLGRLRGDVILACLDSKESRRTANEIAWRLGVPLIDAGVEPSAWLARVTVYQPAPGQPCLECLWDERDYALLSSRHPCQPGGPAAPSSNAPACLGALVASLQAIECGKLLAGQPASPSIGRELLVDAATHKLFVTTLRRNPTCRFDHGTWKIVPLRAGPGELSLRGALHLMGGNGSATLGFGGQALVERLACPACGFARRVFRLSGRLRSSDRHCARCRRPLLLVTGFAMRPRVDSGALDSLASRDATRSLASLGFRAGDVFSVGNGRRERHYEIGGIGVRP